MKSARSGFLLSLLAIAAAFSVQPAKAGNYYNGYVQQLVVGRLQTQVYIQVSNGSQTGWPCGSTHASLLNYAFPLNRPDAAALLSTLMTAYVSNLRVTIIGAGTCSIDPTLEDIGYIWLSK